LDSIIQGEDIGAYGRQHEADNQPGAPVFVQPRQVNFGAGMFACFAFMGMFVAVWGHGIFLKPQYTLIMGRISINDLLPEPDKVGMG
jgi:hypothetical protein